MDRRTFFKSCTFMAAAGLSLPSLAAKGGATAASDLNLLGPKEGYSPQVGTLVSMLTWMRKKAVRYAEGLSREQLDHVFDAKANSIGSLLMHLASTEAFYASHTFDKHKWGEFPEALSARFNVGMELGDEGRAKIKGHDLDHYLGTLKEVREKTLAELKKRDDGWLLAVDEKWPWGPTNTYCKWFHVVEHESHHGGQIAFLRSRLPGAKAGGE